jgi:hypothetical protein
VQIAPPVQRGVQQRRRSPPRKMTAKAQHGRGIPTAREPTSMASGVNAGVWDSPGAYDAGVTQASAGRGRARAT